MTTLKLKKQGKSGYSFVWMGEEVLVSKYYMQGYNRDRSKVKSIFIGWGISEFNTYPTLKAFKEAYSK